MSSLSLSGFATPWLFLYLLIIGVAVVVYLFVQRVRARRS